MWQDIGVQYARPARCGASMRGGDLNTGALFSYVSCEARVAANHPLRAIREIVNLALSALSADFEALYAKLGRPSIPPEKLLRALLLQAFYSVRSERQLMEQLDYNLLFRWFVGLALDAPIWDVTVFTKNRERLVEREVAAKFMAAVLNQPRVKELLSAEHFSADGTLIEAWASMKSFRPKDGGGEPPAAGRNGERDFHGEKRSNETHASTTDADAWLYRKGPGQAAKLAYMGRVLMENRKSGSRYPADPGHRHRRTRGDARDGRRPAGKPPHYAGGRQSLRCRRVRRRAAPGQRHASPRPEHSQPALGDRSPHHPPPRLRPQLPVPQADRADLRLDQSGCRIAQDPSSRPGARRMDLHPHGHRLQSCPAAQAIGCGGVAMPELCPNTPRRSKTPIPAHRNRCIAETKAGIQTMNSKIHPKLAPFSAAC